MRRSNPVSDAAVGHARHLNGTRALNCANPLDGARHLNGTRALNGATVSAAHLGVGRPARRVTALCAAAVLTASVLTGCFATASPGAETEPTTAAEKTQTPSAEAPEPVAVEMPTSCDEVYSQERIDLLTGTHPPLNDPSMTDPNYSNTDELETLVRTLDPLTCTWGVAGPVGIVTAVAQVTAEQSAEALAIMEAAGFTCESESQSDGIHCEIQLEGNDEFLLGESHFLRDDLWLSTLWINASIDGYTEDMVAAIWG